MLRRHFRFIGLALLFVTLAVAQMREKRFVPVDANQRRAFERQPKIAVLVGVDKYPSRSGFGELQHSAHDAALMETQLKAQGYMVQKLTDGEATRSAIESALRSVSDLVDRGSGTVIFFFSGHGFAVDQGSEKPNYLATYESSKADLADSGLSVLRVEELLKATGAPRQVLFLDACRTAVKSPNKGADDRTFARFQIAEGLRALISAKEGQMSYEDDGFGSGVFTHFLVEGLKGQAAGKDGYITFGDLAAYVEEQVRSYGFSTGKTQTPVEKGESSGDFLLANGKVQAPPDPMPVAVAAVPAASTQSDVQRYIAAMALRDPDQLEAAAKTISTPTYADALRRRAQLLRGAGGAPGVGGIPTDAVHAGSDARERLRLANVKTQAHAASRRGNYLQAFPLYKELAGSGDSEAMGDLGNMYYSGLGTKQDYAEAVKWFQKAADLGETKIMATLGLMYALGRGVPKNDELSVQWNRKAAEAGDAIGMLGLGFMYQNGRGVSRDTAQAAEWYRKSAALGNEAAKQNLKRMGLN